MGIMKTIRFLVAMAIVAALGVGVTGTASAAEKAGRMPATQQVEKAGRKAAKPVKKAKAGQKKAGSGKKAEEVGKKFDVRKNTEASKKSA
jgi:hypothetical protein